MTALADPRTNDVLTTSRQIRNEQLWDMGITPRESYQTGKLGPGDEVECFEVAADPLAPEEKRYRAVILEVKDHGWYIKVHLRHDEPDDKATEDVTLMRDGPPQYGIVEFRVTKKVYKRPEPVKGRNPDSVDRRDVYFTEEGRIVL